MPLQMIVSPNSAERTLPCDRAMSRDPEVYSNPEMFMPERFLDADGQLDVSKGDPTEFMFGFGRR